MKHFKEEEIIEGIKNVPDVGRKKQFVMTEKHKEAIRKYHKKRIYMTKEQKEYILRAKKNNVPYEELTRNFNKKFETDYIKTDIQKKYLKIREE